MGAGARPDPPVVSRTELVRPRLLEQVAGRFRRQVTVVLAPAGFGKTTLLSRAVRENLLAPQGADRWLSCRPEHDLLSVLAGALRAAVGLPEAVPTSTATPREVALQVADALWTAAPEHVALLLDDVHHLRAGGPAAALLTELLSLLPGNAHVVLAGRPPLPVPVARLIASGDGLLLQERDLEFTGRELEAFAVLRSVSVDPLRRIGRWPALAELQATVGSAAVADYLWEELLSRLAPARRRALAVLLAVGGADAELADAVLGPSDLPALLEGLPLVASTSDGWWSLHALWEPVLRSEATPEVRASARRTAGGVLRRRGLLHEAMTQLFLAEAWDDVRDLVVHVCGSFFPLVPVDVLQQWWQRLPEALQDDPAGLLLAAVACESRNPVEGARLLELAHRAAGGVGEVALASTQSLTMISFWRSDTQRLPELHRRLETLAAGGFSEAAATLSLSRALLARDADTVRRELASAPLLASARLAPAVDWLRAHLVLLHLGDPATALLLAQAALHDAPSTLRAAIRCELVECLRLLGRLAEAEAAVEALLEDVEESVVHTPRHLLAAAVVRGVSGDTDGALDVLARMRAMLGSTPVVWAPWAEALARAHVALSRGQEDEAAAAVAPFAGSSVARCRTWLRINPSALPVLYVLVPGTRAGWDALQLPGCFQDSRAAAAALVELRAGAPAAVRDLTLASWGPLSGQLPLTWTVELAAARSAAGLPEGQQLVAGLGRPCRPALRALLGSGRPALQVGAHRLLARLPAVPRRTVRLRVLGHLRVFLDDAEVQDPDLRRERVKALLGRLLLSPTQPRARLAEAMWPDLAEPAAARNLRVTLNYLQHLLEPDRDAEDAPAFVQTTGPVLHLVTDTAFDVDAWRFDALLDEAEKAERHAAPSMAIGSYARAVALYGGPLLEDLHDEEWLSAERERLRARFVGAAVRLGQLRLAQWEPAEVEVLAARALVADPYCEGAYQLLAEVRLRRGDRAAAVRALRECRTRLDELGVEPLPGTLRLEGVVRAGS